MTQAKFTGELYVKEFTKAERAASRATRAAARPAKREERRARRALSKLYKKTAATLSEDRKRSYLATYTAEVKAAREARRANVTVGI